MKKEIKLKKNTIHTNIRKVLTGLFTGFIFMIASFTCGNIFEGNVSARAETHDYKYFVSVPVHAGDTLYSIAEEYYSKDYYDDMEDYLKEVCRSNHIDDRDRISAGDYVIMPYYAEFVAYTDTSNNPSDRSGSLLSATNE